MFTPSVDKVMSVFTDTISKLETVAEKQRTKHAEKAKKAAELTVEAGNHLSEASRADNYITKLRAMLEG